MVNDAGGGGMEQSRGAIRADDREKNVLVVDDEEVVRMVLKELLVRLGFKVTTAATGAEALALLRKGTFSLAVVDKNLPDRSGLEVMKKSRGISPDTGTVIVTAYASLESAIEALQLGAYDYILKPFDDLTIVGAKITNALRRQTLNRQNKVLAENLSTANMDLREAVGRLDKSKNAIGMINKVLQAKVDQAADSLKKANQELVRMSKVKKELLTMISREIQQVQSVVRSHLGDQPPLTTHQMMEISHRLQILLGMIEDTIESY